MHGVHEKNVGIHASLLYTKYNCLPMLSRRKTVVKGAVVFSCTLCQVHVRTMRIFKYTHRLKAETWGTYAGFNVTHCPNSNMNKGINYQEWPARKIWHTSLENSIRITQICILDINPLTQLLLIIGSIVLNTTNIPIV